MAEKEALFSKRNKKLISDPLNDNNPITIQVLGICSALAITVQLKPAVVMAISVLVVLSVANVVISFMRHLIPNRIRIIVQLVVIATLVTLVDQVLKAYVYDVSKELTVFVGLIITNCIIMGRLEAFGMANGPWKSFLDGIGNLTHSFVHGWDNLPEHLTAKVRTLDMAVERKGSSSPRSPIIPCVGYVEYPDQPEPLGGTRWGDYQYATKKGMLDARRYYYIDNRELEQAKKIDIQAVSASSNAVNKLLEKFGVKNEG